MKNTWVVVAHRAGARIFEHAGPAMGLTLVEEIAHEEGRKKGSELDSDRAGMTFSRKGPGRHPMGAEDASHDRLATSFAKELGNRLATGRNARRFEHIVLVAEPRFLGMLRDALDAQTTALVAASIGKDLAHVAQRDLPAHLESVLRY